MKLAGARFEKADSALGQALWDQLDPGQTEDAAGRISQLQRDHADSADAYLTTIRHAIAKAEKHPAALEKIFDHVGQGLQGSTTAWHNVVNKLNTLVITASVRENHDAQSQVADANTNRANRLDVLFATEPTKKTSAEVVKLLGEVAGSGEHLALPFLRRAARSILERYSIQANGSGLQQFHVTPPLSDANPTVSARTPLSHSNNFAGAWGLSDAVWDAQSRLDDMSRSIPNGDGQLNIEKAQRGLDSFKALWAQANGALDLFDTRPDRLALQTLLSRVDREIKRVESFLAHLHVENQ